ncbi:MAG TPA: HAD-IA family hydrolase [Devosiaceae bacterium]|nr:HAD-IA family hydrolase [Devosiaceae bacterium]
MRLVIFDMDGTLIDSELLIIETVTAAFEAVGEPVPTEAAIRSISGITLRPAIRILAPLASDDLIEELLASYRAYYSRVSGGPREPLFEGALAALERLRHRDDTILAVATGKGHRGAVTLLTAHGIFDWFHSVETPDHNRGKPDPQMIETAMGKVGAAAEATVMIGDTIHDMKMGKAAGVATIGVAWGYHETVDLEAAGADIVIDRFDQLDAAIDQLLG